MTMARSEKQGSQGKKLRNFKDKLSLNETAQRQQTDLQWQLLKNQCHKGDDMHGRTEKHEDHRGKEAQGDGEVAPQAKSIDGCVNHLLILAQSAEIVAQSEDSLVGVQTDNQSRGPSSNIVDQVSQDNGSNVAAGDSRESSQRSGFCYEVTKPRLTQIRKQARQKYLLLDQEKNEDSKLKDDVQGKTIRLSEIKHQARCKSNNDLLLQEKNEGHKDEELQEKNIRLCQMKHLARLKGKSTIKERTEEHVNGHVYCDKFEDNKKTKVIARQAEEEHICQGANSARQKEFGSLKGRKRLTQLRREVRLGNQCYVRQGAAEN